MAETEPPNYRSTDLSSPSGADADALAKLSGRQGRYRLGFASMQIPGMPERLRIGEVLAEQIMGPVETQRTTVVQHPGLAPTFEKWMERPLVGRGRPLTVYSREVVIADDLPRAVEAWRDEILAAAGFLSMLLDERVAQELIFEDLVVAPEEEEGVPDYVDTQRSIRTFEPTQLWLPPLESELQRFQPRGNGSHLHAACRWYLRSMSAGPSADGVVLLWTTLECMVPAPSDGRARNQVRDLERALREADPSLDPDSMIDPPHGRLAGLRGRILHRGVETDETIRDAFYTLEALSRLLLRHALGASAGWPLHPSTPMLAQRLQGLQRAPRTIWRDPPRA